MIYILLGNDSKKKSNYLKKLYKNDLPIFVSNSSVTKKELFDQAGSVSLFGGSPIVVLDNIIKDGNLDLSKEDILILKNSETTFVFLEDKLSALDLKKYKKEATIEDFNIDIKKTPPKINVFGIADAFSDRNKIGTWILYREAILQGISPEEISGIIFWKIKTMILSGSKSFSIDELKMRSSELVDLYHNSHNGESDFVIGLEQFILNSLNK